MAGEVTETTLREIVDITRKSKANIEKVVGEDEAKIVELTDQVKDLKEEISLFKALLVLADSEWPPLGEG